MRAKGIGPPSAAASVARPEVRRKLRRLAAERFMKCVLLMAMLAGVAVACMTRYTDLIRIEGLKYHGIYYFVPGMLNHFDSEAIMALAAPRPMLYLTGDKDYGSPIEGIRKLEAKVRPAYGLYRAEANFENIVYPGLGHVYLPEMWDKMVGWMDKHVRDTK